MPVVKTTPTDAQMTETEDTWAQDVFKEIGESYPSLALAFDELYVTQREQEEAELSAAATEMDEEDRIRVEKTAKEAAISSMILDDNERISDISLDLSAYRENASQTRNVADSDNADLLAVLNTQIKDCDKQRELLFSQLRKFGDLELEKDSFETLYELSGLLIEKAMAERDRGAYEACDGVVDETQEKLRRMQSLLDEAKQHNKPAALHTLSPEYVGDYVEFVLDVIEDMNEINYTGLSTRLLVTLNKNQAAKKVRESPSWDALMKTARDCKAAKLQLSNMSKYILKLCDSMCTAGPNEEADDIYRELTGYQNDNSRDLPNVIRFVSALKATAVRKEKWAKRKEWAKTNLDVRTRNYKAQLEKLVIFKDEEHVETKKSQKEAYARAVDVEGLNKDVMKDIPKRPHDKTAKAVPRATVDSLLESLDFLDELQSSGVSGMETIAVEEFLKTDEILDGINRNPEGYADLQKRTQKMLEKIAETKSGKEGLYYIEEKIRLVEDIQNLRERSAAMNINTAIRECQEIKTTRLNLLLKNLKYALAYRDIFNEKQGELEKIFKNIPVLLAKLGAARPELAKKFKKVWAPKQEKVYHGELVMQMKQAKIAADAASTADDLREAINQLNRVHVQAEKYVEELKKRVDKPQEMVDAPFSPDEDEFFRKIEADYKEGVQLAKDRKVAKGKFNEKAGPLKDELEMLTSKSASWKNMKAKIKGIERIDEATFDPSRFKDLLTEVKLLEQECVVNSSYEENMSKLDELKGLYDAMRSELTGFREDIAKSIGEATEKCVTRMEIAQGFLENYFVDIVLGKEELGESYVNASALKRFAGCVAKPIVPGDLKKYAQIIADKRQPMDARKKAREDALRIVRPLLARLDSDKAIKLYRRHPFSDMENNLNILRPALVQLEIKLLTLAS